MSRRTEIQMNDEEIRDYLTNSRTVILVTNGRRGHPHAVAMFYTTDDDLTVNMATYGRSQKIKNIERDPKVTLLVESGEKYEELRGLMIQGTATITEDLDKTVQVMVEATSTPDQQLPDASELDQDLKVAMAGKRLLIRVKPERFVSWDHSKLSAGETPAAL
jgi:PPOX class probable F420-dependent enzyme